MTILNAIVSRRQFFVGTAALLILGPATRAQASRASSRSEPSLNAPAASNDYSNILGLL